MATLNLTQTNPEYDATRAARVKSRDLFEGADVVKAKRETYLFKGKNETDADYEKRLQRATLDPYVAKIVISRQAVVHGKAAVRELPAELQKYLDDVDRKGTSAQTFFEDCTKEAQIDGIHWVLIDMPRTPVGGFRTRRDEEIAGHKPFFQHLPADCVIDWQVGDDRRLDWAVIAETVQKAPIEAGGERESVNQWKIWTRTSWSVYRIAEGGQTAGYRLVDQGGNPLGEVPLVPFFGIMKTDYSGWPVARSVLAHVLQIYNKESDLDWYETLAAHPVPWIIAPVKPEKLDVTQGIWMQSDATGAPIQIGYLETTGNAFSALRESIRDVAARILSIALAQAKKETAQVQSAEGQREDRRIFTTSLKGFSVHAQHSEQRCWRTLAKWLRLGEAPIASINVDYNKDFDDRIIEATMINALADLVDASQLTNETLLQILKDGEVLPEDTDVSEELEKLQAAKARAAATTIRLLNQGAQQDPIEGGQAA